MSDQEAGYRDDRHHLPGIRDRHAAGPGPATAGQSPAPKEAPATLAGRLRRSFLASVGSIVFGMEDGTVSIFGLVFGVAASAPNSSAVLLAAAPARSPPRCR